MANVTIRLRHCVWRDGKPRFQPGPKLRRLGFKGEDLRHPDGAWLTLAEAAAWVEAREAVIAAARAGRRRVPPATGRRPAAAVYTVGDLFEDYWRSPRLSGEDVEVGRRRQKTLSPKTIRDYRGKARALEAYDAELWGAAVTALDRSILYGLYEELWRDKGLSMARGILAVLSAAITWGMNRGKIRFPVNPALGLGMQMPEPRVRAGEPEEMRALIAAADALKRPEMGDSFVLALWTGQRQNDRLALVYGPAGAVPGRIVFRQSKTGAIVSLPVAAELESRLAAARDRRRPAVNVEQLFTGEPVILDEAQGQPWKPDHYRRVYAEIRDAAASGMRPGPDGALVRFAPACRPLADFQERDLRDTAVTWLARSGATIPEICAVTGHSEASATTILKHYLARHPELSDTAIAKMVKWYSTRSASNG